ncbi:hypothetical protein HHK36_012133 [Tetracentron sinense]|nr:hypothetical protein HHK36_012133 [Tetracentron sinense]
MSNSEKAPGGSKELNLVKAENLKPQVVIPEPKPHLLAAEPYPLEGSPSSIIIGNNDSTTTPTKKFFLDRFVTSHESSTSSCRPSNSEGYFPLQQLNYGTNARLSANPNPSLWFNQNCRPFEMNSEYNTGSISTTLPSMSSSILPAPMGFKPSVSLPSDSPSTGSFSINRVPYWEAGTSSNSSSCNSGSSSSIELQSNNSFFDNSVFSWGLADCSTSDKEARIHSVEGEPEDIKWSEYLQTPFLLPATIQNQTPQPIYSEIKSETQFRTDGSTPWHQNQQQQPPLQASDIYAKDLQRFAAAFGQF